MRRIVLLSAYGIKVIGEFEGNRLVKLRQEGILSLFARNQIKILEKFLRSEKPAFVGRDFILFSLLVPPLPSKQANRIFKTEIKRRVFGICKLQAISIAVTRACSANCIYCGYVGSYDYSKELTKEEVYKTINCAYKLGATVIIFYGGNPLLRGDLPELISYSRKMGMWSVLFTPGMLLTEDRALELKNAGLNAVYIVLHSKKEDDHDSLLQFRGAHKQALSAVSNCLKVGLWTGITTYATAERINNGCIEELVNYAATLKVHEVLISDVLPAGKLLRRDDIILSNSYLSKLSELQHIKNNPDSPGPRVSVRSCLEGPQGVGCIAGVRWLYVNPQGYVLPCGYMPFHFGNIREKSLENIWRYMLKNPLISEQKNYCLMQDRGFRRRYIHKIPPNAELPYPAWKIFE